MTTSRRIQILRASERPATAWLNGGGVTREVAGFPAGAGLDAFDWRVSLADVAAAGPFSEFPGIDRVITLVEGPGMVLTVDGTEHHVDAPYRPFAFSGEAATDCRLLAGPVVDFNVMTRRGKVTAHLDLVTAPVSADVPPGGAVLVVCLAGSTTIEATVEGTVEAAAATALEASAEISADSTEPAHRDTVQLARYDAALLDHPGAHRLRVDGVTAVVTFRPAR
ncbi:HutD family protein [Streptomyces kaniharaensis]|uniref:HutD family protein n=1 Tax=Streptomyces kaniharaensis TaxID=212423 RepID=A0A6N7KUJ7_9ACTN|nr:HutD family protein [Streptomyces kaniharaensis]MQS15322.1 HutD family protein [Streptomyces kaniharaensis]